MNIYILIDDMIVNIFIDCDNYLKVLGCVCLWIFLWFNGEYSGYGHYIIYFKNVIFFSFILIILDNKGVDVISTIVYLTEIYLTSKPNIFYYIKFLIN